MKYTVKAFVFDVCLFNWKEKHFNNFFFVHRFVSFSQYSNPLLVFAGTYV